MVQESIHIKFDDKEPGNKMLELVEKKILQIFMYLKTLQKLMVQKLVVQKLVV